MTTKGTDNKRIASEKETDARMMDREADMEPHDWGNSKSNVIFGHFENCWLVTPECSPMKPEAAALKQFQDLRPPVTQLPESKGVLPWEMG